MSSFTIIIIIITRGDIEPESITSSSSSLSFSFPGDTSVDPRRRMDTPSPGWAFCPHLPSLGCIFMTPPGNELSSFFLLSPPHWDGTIARVTLRFLLEVEPILWLIYPSRRCLEIMHSDRLTDKEIAIQRVVSLSITLRRMRAIICPPTNHTTNWPTTSQPSSGGDLTGRPH